jgi:hypothetical protein
VENQALFQRTGSALRLSFLFCLASLFFNFSFSLFLLELYLPALSPS